MCGISGVVAGSERSAQDAVAHQLELLHHRGPDAAGTFGSPAAIGQNRLAIIDVEGGDPPITDEDGAIGVALNGEIYNFRALRERLTRDGHRFRTRGDTEVIAHLAEDLVGARLARELDGMFAFAVWDERRKQLTLARDRLGKKPLYYWTDRDTLVFASEIKGVLAHSPVPRELEPAAFAPYLGFGYVPTPRTFFRGIRSVPPGHVLTFTPGEAPRLKRYWSPPVAGLAGTTQLDVSLPEAAALVRGSLDAAVQRRLVADVPLGAFLSGGVDSSAVVALMAQATDRPVETFTIGFDDADGYDERPYARLVADHHGTNHHEFVVAPDAVDLVERLVWHHDQPFGDSSAIPTFLLSELTRQHVTVALSGDGGDELFAGYERFAAALAAGRYERIPRPVRERLARALDALPSQGLSRHVRRAQRFTSFGASGLPDALRAWASFIDAPTRNALLGAHRDWGAEDYAAIWRSSEGAHTLDRILDLNLRTYLLDDLLVKVDRTSMAHGLEVRSPFLDTELVELAMRLPPRVKLRGLSLKRVLKAAMADVLPREILRRPKRGFGVPLDRWFRDDLAGYVGATLGSPRASVRQHLDGGAIDRLLGEHASGARQHGQALWTLLTLEVFLRREGW